MKTILSIFVFGFLFNPNYSLSQWGQCDGPPGGEVNFITATKKAVFAGNSDELFYTTNGGESWSASILNDYILSITSSDSLVYACTVDKVLSSKNNGVSWDTLVNSQFRILVVNGSTLYSYKYAQGIFSSTNNGSSWSNILSTSSPISSLCANNNYIYVKMQDSLLISSNNGVTWITNKNNIIYTLGNFSFSGDIIYATSYLGLLRSTNHGSTWLQISSITDFQALLCSGDNFIAAGTQGIYRSRNNGYNWILSSPNYKNVNFFVVSGNNIFAGTNSSGVLQTSNGGVTWERSHYNKQKITAVKFLNGYLFAGTFTIGNQTNGIYKSEDNGNNWRHLELTENINDIVNIDSTIFAGTDRGVFYSTDFGTHWLSTPLNGEVTDLVVKNNNIYAGIYNGITNGGIYFSSNRGISWSLIGFQNLTVSSVKILDSAVFVINSNGIFRTYNNGSTWERIALNIQNPTTLYSDGKNIIIGTLNNGIFISSDFGQTLIQSQLPSQFWIKKIIAYNDNLFVASSQELYLSRDRGISWQTIRQGLNTFVNTIEINNNYIYLGTNKSCWKRPLKDLISVQNTSLIVPNNFSLLQNYPNPFNPGTVISFQLPVNSFVSLKVYDVNGREISELVNEKLNSGEYKINFDGSRLPSGVYYYKMITENFSETKKMILIK